MVTPPNRKKKNGIERKWVMPDLKDHGLSGKHLQAVTSSVQMFYEGLNEVSSPGFLMMNSGNDYSCLCSIRWRRDYKSKFVILLLLGSVEEFQEELAQYVGAIFQEWSNLGDIKYGMNVPRIPKRRVRKVKGRCGNRRKKPNRYLLQTSTLSIEL